MKRLLKVILLFIIHITFSTSDGYSLTAEKAWVTLVTTDNYGLGALVLGHSLKRVKTVHQLVVLVTNKVTNSMKEQLSTIFDSVQEVEEFNSNDMESLKSFNRPELGVTFTKIHCWNLTNYSKAVFLDADILVLKNSDELFDREEISAVSELAWPDCFNTGVFVFKPSKETFKALYTMAKLNGSFDGTVQGLLNTYFSYWPTKDIKHHIPFIYNMVTTIGYGHIPSFKAYGSQIKIVHFSGQYKPWTQNNDETGKIKLTGFIHLWLNIFVKHVLSNLNPNMNGLAGALARAKLNNYTPFWKNTDLLQQGVILRFVGRQMFDKLTETNVCAKDTDELLAISNLSDYDKCIRSIETLIVSEKNKNKEVEKNRRWEL